MPISDTLNRIQSLANYTAAPLAGEARRHCLEIRDLATELQDRQLDELMAEARDLLWDLYHGHATLEDHRVVTLYNRMSSETSGVVVKKK